MIGRIEILDFINQQAQQDDLHVLQQAIQRKKVFLAETMAATLRRGDRVELFNLSPKSTEGATGTIQTILKKRAEVLFDDLKDQPSGVYFGRFQATIRNKVPLRVPIQCLRPLAR